MSEEETTRARIELEEEAAVVAADGLNLLPRRLLHRQHALGRVDAEVINTPLVKGRIVAAGAAA